MIYHIKMVNPSERGMNSFTHAGEYGDLCYSLPTVKALGGGVIYLSLLNGVTRCTMTKQDRDWLAPLFESQPYIKGLKMYSGQAIAYNLNYFRNYWREHPEFAVNLAQWHCRAFEIDEKVVQEPWLQCDAKPIQPVVIHRSERYHNNDFPWKRVLDKYKGKCVFIGLPQEHRKFTEQFGHLPFYQVVDSLDMAQVIQGCQLMVCNQSFPCSVGEGLKKPKIMECWLVDPNTIFERADLQVVFTRNIYLPEI
jgi:hypothetical protein